MSKHAYLVTDDNYSGSTSKTIKGCFDCKRCAELYYELYEGRERGWVIVLLHIQKCSGEEGE